MVVGTDVCVCVVFLFGDIVLPGGNSPAQLDDHMTISHVMMGIKPVLQLWGASAIPLRQSNSCTLFQP